MKDKLEKFIEENRGAFDMYEPNPDVWKKIEKNIRGKAISLRKVLWRAAAVAIIFGASFLFHRYVEMIKKPEKDFAAIPELTEAELYYTGLLGSKLDEITPFLKEHPGVEKGIMQDLYELDSLYKEMKKDLKDDVANQEVVEAMVQNYRLRLDILEDILRELKNTNHHENENNQVNL